MLPGLSPALRIGRSGGSSTIRIQHVALHYCLLTVDLTSNCKVCSLFAYGGISETAH